MEIVHDFSPDGDPDPVRGRLDQLELQLALVQQALGHDLPNQMMALQGLARLVEPGSGAAENRTLLDRIAAVACEADERIRALAALGRLLRRSEGVQAFDLTQLVREAVIETRVLFKDRSADYHFPDDMPTATANRAQVYQLTTHLLRNAVQATVSERAPVVDIAARRLGTAGVELRVADNGRGMTAFQLNQARAIFAGEPGGSPGLGLVIVRQVVAGWRGAIRISSEAGRGTAVTILARSL